MPFCGACGHKVDSEAQFCPECGSSLARWRSASAGADASVTPPETTTPIGGQVTAAAAWARRQRSQWDASRIASAETRAHASQLASKAPAIAHRFVIGGDWLAAALIGGVAFAAALVMALLAILFSGASLTASQLTTAVVLLTAGAFGSPAIASSSSGPYQASVTVSAYPLTMSIVALGVAGLLYQHSIRDEQSLSSALGMATRASAALAVLLAVATWLFRGSFAVSLPFAGFGLPTLAGEMHAGPFASATRGFIAMFIVCCGVCLLTLRSPSPAVRRLRDFLAPPLAGLTIVLMSACALGVLGGVAVMVTSDSPPSAGVGLALLLTVAVNAGLLLLLMGTGTGLYVVNSSSDGSGFVNASYGLGDAANVVGGWAWLLPAISAVAITGGAFAMSRRIDGREAGRVSYGRWVPLALLGTVLSVRLTAYSARAEAALPGGGSNWWDLSIGLDLPKALFLMTLWLLVSLVVARALLKSMRNRNVGSPPAPQRQEGGEHSDRSPSPPSGFEI